RHPELELPALQAAIDARYAESATLDGAVLGRRRARDQRELAAMLARALLPGRPVFLYRHAFEEQLDGWEGLATRDVGLLDRIVLDATQAAITDTVSLAFRRAGHYATADRHLDGDRAVAKRYATAANREGIRRVSLGVYAAAARAFRQAIAHDAAYAQPWRNLGLLAADYLDAPALAAEAWSHYLELETDPVAANAVRQRLEALRPPPPDRSP
ncbi:MAG: hypothetical protein PVF43_05405, partial [Candidatus Eiseniibacteriota bacterium]